MHYRSALALTLILAIFLTSLGLTVTAQAQTSSASSGIDNDHFLVYKADDGDTICREANAAERRRSKRSHPKNLRQVNHLGDERRCRFGDRKTPKRNLTIILRATAKLDANAPAKAAFIRAAAAWEAVVNSPVTIYLDADFGPDNFGTPWSRGMLGATSSPSLERLLYKRSQQPDYRREHAGETGRISRRCRPIPFRLMDRFGNMHARVSVSTLDRAARLVC